MSGCPTEAFIVAIDGPAGAGKSTVSRMVAARLGFALVDTGAIYRTATLAALRAGVAFDDDRGLEALLGALPITFGQGAQGGEGVFLEGEDVSDAIRTPEISLGASVISARPVVRAGLLELQRRLARAATKGAVLEGRDIGTVVFPDADAKFFLTGEERIRAARRHAELTSKGRTITLEQVLADQRKRDEDDRQRAIAPLLQADDAVAIDTTASSKEEVAARIIDVIQRRLASKRAEH